MSDRDGDICDYAAIWCVLGRSLNTYLRNDIWVTDHQFVC